MSGTQNEKNSVQSLVVDTCILSAFADKAFNVKPDVNINIQVLNQV